MSDSVNVLLVVILLVTVPMVELVLLRRLVPLLGPMVIMMWLVLAVVAGVSVIRRGGGSALRRLRSQLRQGELPGRSTLQDVLLMLGGVMLVFPGFMTDVLALPLLVGSTRRAIAELIIGKLTRRFGFGEPANNEEVYSVGPDGRPIRDIEVEVHTETEPEDNRELKSPEAK